MVLICGEVSQNKLRICFLEEETQTWYGHHQKFQVRAYVPYFLNISNSSSEPCFHLHFHSETGQIRTGHVSKKPKDAWVVSCNNRHTIRPSSIWPDIAQSPADILFHLGDQVYADRVYWRWWKYLSTMSEDCWKLYQPDIERDYYREYYETWTPLSDILSHTSNIMIPDDHEMRDQAEVWDYLMAGAPSEKASWEAMKQLPILTDIFLPEGPSHKSQLEKFLFQVAFRICQKLYLGLRLTNRESFDYFRVINGVSVIMTERISQPFLGKTFLKKFQKFQSEHSRISKILWMGGLPPCPIRPNFWELVVYRHVSDIPDSRYEKLYEVLFEAAHLNCDCSSSPSPSFSFQEKDEGQLILIGGDLHAGTEGRIFKKNCSHQSAKFYVSSPSSGFPSAYIPEDCLDSTENYQVVIDRYQPADPNAVHINFHPFTSYPIFKKGSWADCWQNALSTGYVFWS